MEYVVEYWCRIQGMSEKCYVKNDLFPLQNSAVLQSILQLPIDNKMKVGIGTSIVMVLYWYSQIVPSVLCLYLAKLFILMMMSSWNYKIGCGKQYEFVKK